MGDLKKLAQKAKAQENEQARDDVDEMFGGEDAEAEPDKPDDTSEEGPEKADAEGDGDTEEVTAKEDTNDEADTEDGNATRQGKGDGDAAQSSTTEGFAAGEFKMIGLDQIDLEDESLRFRSSLRLNKLKESIEAHGIQVPIILRARGRGKKKYRLVSGFRRCHAAEELGMVEVPATIREGMDDEEAFHASVLENMARKTLSAIDRAVVIREYRDRGLAGGVDGARDVLQITERQKRNLLSLLKLPQDVQDAIDDPDQAFTGTHGVALKRLVGKYPKLDYAKWVKAVNDSADGDGKNSMSVDKLKREVNKEHGGKAESKPFVSLFREDDTDAKSHSNRFHETRWNHV